MCDSGVSAERRVWRGPEADLLEAHCTGNIEAQRRSGKAEDGLARLPPWTCKSLYLETTSLGPFCK